MATTPDLSNLSSNFLKFGGQVFMKNVNEWAISKDGVLIMKNVKTPMALPKLSALGNPRPYREQDDTTSQGVEVTDRILTVRAAKWDMDFDPEKFRNTYLASDADKFYNYALDQISKEFLAQINDNTAYLGSYNAAGTTAAAIATGWGTTIAAEIVDENITPVATGAVTNANAVTKVEEMISAAPAWMRNRATIMYCSYATLDKYKTHYRSTFGFTFQPREVNKYMIDGTMCELKPVSWMGTSSRLILTVANNLVMGLDGESVKFHNSVRRNIIELRPMMNVGFEIADLAAMKVNDQA
jgi:hypothetical protein